MMARLEQHPGINCGHARTLVRSNRREEHKNITNATTMACYRATEGSVCVRTCMDRWHRQQHVFVHLCCLDWSFVRVAYRLLIVLEYDSSQFVPSTLPPVIV
jgi:hypothetical protein